jgi:hypothetical protein
MLRKWRTKAGNESTLQTLRTAVQEIRYVTLDWNSIESTSGSFLFELDTLITSRPVLEDDIRKLSEAFGDNCQLLGPRVGVSSQIVSACEHNNPRRTDMQIIEMLIHWQTLSAEQDKFDRLIPVLLTSPMVDVDWDTVKNVIEGI